MDVNQAVKSLAGRLRELSISASHDRSEDAFVVYANPRQSGQSCFAEIVFKKIQEHSNAGGILIRLRAERVLRPVWLMEHGTPAFRNLGPMPVTGEPTLFGSDRLNQLGEKLLCQNIAPPCCTHHQKGGCVPSCYPILTHLPDVLADCIVPPKVCEDVPNSIAEFSSRQCWLFAVRLVEALTLVHPRYLDEHTAETRDFRTRLALMRFILLSAPFRQGLGKLWKHGEKDWEGIWGKTEWEGVLSQPHLVDRAGFAADEWRERLMTYQSDDAALRWNEIVEREARLLVWETALFKRDPLSISMQRILPGVHDEAQDIDDVSEGQRIRKHRLMARDFFLPRLMLRDAYVPPRLDNGRRRLNFIFNHPLSVIIVAIGAIGTFALLAQIQRLVISRWGLSSTQFQTLIPPAWHEIVIQPVVHPLICSVFLAGCVFLIIIVVSIARHNPGVAYPMCLRMPAVTGIGLAALFTVDATVWQGNQQWSVVVLFVLLALGYVFIEARNHDVPTRDARRRSLLVVLVGLAQSFFVAAAGLKFLAPVLAERFVQPSNWIDAAWSLSFVASGGLALGVFLQVLWESRPITYPLTHLEWTDRSDRATGSLFGGR